jgi:hypothetical protein
MAVGYKIYALYISTKKKHIDPAKEQLTLDNSMPLKS